MSIQENVRNIVYYFIKKEYKKYLEENQLKYIENNKLEGVVENFYVKKEKILKSFIRENLKKMMKDDYPGALVENIIYDIFEDEKLAKNRIILEIREFQKSNKSSMLSSNIYNVNIVPDKEYGLGINLSIENDRIIVEGFKKHSNRDKVLPAEGSKLINIGDELIEIDNKNLRNMTTEKIVKILKNINNKNKVNIKFNSKKNSELFDKNYNEVCVN